MTVYQVPEIHCDTEGCFEKYQLEDAPATPKQARKTAELDGWSFMKRGDTTRDFCAGCADAIMLGTGEGPEDDGD